jgi:hypothetical protein
MGVSVTMTPPYGAGGGSWHGGKMSRGRDEWKQRRRRAFAIAGKAAGSRDLFAHAAAGPGKSPAEKKSPDRNLSPWGVNKFQTCVLG